MTVWKQEEVTTDAYGFGSTDWGWMFFVGDLPTWEDGIVFALERMKERELTPLAVLMNEEDYADLQQGLKDEGRKLKKGKKWLITYKGIAVSDARRVLPDHLFLPCKEGK